MSKAKFQERASQSKGKLIALASVDGNDPVHTLHCSSCGSDQVVSASFDDPHCANCGSDEMYATKDAEMEVADEVETVGYECAHCNTAVHIATAAVASLNNRVCCSNCGTAVELDLADETAAESTDAEGEITAQDTTELEEEADVAIDDLQVEGADEELDFPGEVIEVTEATSQSDEVPNNDYEFATEGEPLVDSVEADDTLENVELCSLSNRLCVAKNAVVIASLNEQEAGENGDILNTDTFEQAFRTTASSQGLRKALASYGFKLVRTKSLTKASVTSAVSKATQQIKASVKLQQASMVECTALASACLSRGIIKRDLSIVSAIANELSALGLTNATVTARKILANTGHDFAKAIMAEGDKLAKATVEYRKDLQQALSDENLDFQATDTEDAEGEDSIEAQVQARLSKPATVAALLRPQVVNASSSVGSGTLFSNL